MNTNEKLTDIIGSNRIFPIFTTDISKPAIVYSYIPVTFGHIKQTQLKLNIIWNDYDKVKEIENLVKDILAMDENSNFLVYKDIYFKSLLCGGGVIFRDDLQMYENNLIFIIKWR